MMSIKSGYSLLAVLAGLYLVFVYRYQSTPRYILLATIIFAVLYFIWGIFHHLHDRSGSGKIVLEYLLVAALAVVIVSTLLI
jgi:hypothetical protein